MFIVFSRFSLILVDFRAPKPFVSVSALPAALRRPQKKHALEFGIMYLVDFVEFCRF